MFFVNLQFAQRIELTRSYISENIYRQIFSITKFAFYSILGLLYAFIFGQVTNIISQLQKNTNNFIAQINSIKRFNTIYKVPKSVGNRIENYFTATWTITKGTNKAEVMIDFLFFNSFPLLNINR